MMLSSRNCPSRQDTKSKYLISAVSVAFGVLTAMILVTEIGDARRFPHPSNLTSYSGMDIREHSSGGKEKKFGITKMGNHHIRRTVVEACQRVGLRCVVSKRLKAARADQPEQVIEVADRCMARLRKRYHHLLHRGQEHQQGKGCVCEGDVSFCVGDNVYGLLMRGGCLSPCKR